MPKKTAVEIKVLYGSLLAFFGVFLLLPLGRMLLQALTGKTGFSLEHLSKILGEGTFWQAMGNSMSVSALSALISVVLALILAYTLQYTKLPTWLGQGIHALAVFPMLLPTMTYGFAILYAFGKQGLLTKLTGVQFFELYGFQGLVMGYVIYTLPIAFLLIHNSMHYVDQKYITVSRLMGDPPLRRFFVSTIRPIVGTIGAAFIQSFFLAFTDFGIPAAIGGEYEVVASILYNTMLGSVPNFGDGAVVAISMIVPSVVSILLLSYLDRFNFRYDKVTRETPTRHLGRDVTFGTLSVLIVLSIVLIFAVIFIIPFVKMWPYELHFTWQHFRDIFSKSQLFYIYRNSLLVAGLTGVFGTAFAYGAALVTQRSPLSPKSKQILESTALVINTIPGMVLGIAFLLCFTGTSLQNTILILLISNIVHFFSTPYLMMKNALSKLNASFETTALLMGDSWLQTLVRVITPNVKHSIFSVFSYYFVNAMVTISAVIFLAGAKTMIITSKMKELQYMAKFEQIFVFSLLILFSNLIVKLLVKFATGKHQSLTK